MRVKKAIYGAILSASLLVGGSITAFAAEELPVADTSSLLPAIIIALIIAGIIAAVSYSSMKSVHKATSASNYQVEGSFRLSSNSDMHVRTTQRTIHHEKPKQQ